MVPPSAGPVMIQVIIILALVAAAMAGDLYDANVLLAGQRLQFYSGNQELRWGPYELILNDKCNLQSAEASVKVLWRTNTNGNGGYCALHMQVDGNLVLYNLKNVLWQSNTRGRRGENVCLLRQDGNLAIYGSPIWSTRKPWYPASTPAASLQRDQTPPSTKLGAPSTSAGYVQNVLYEGEQLQAGEELRAKSYRFIMQEDCNLVLYNGYDSLWTSDSTQHGPNCYLELKSNGNLIIYNQLGYPVWHSGTAGKGGDLVLIVQDDGAVVLYSKALWSKPDPVSSGLTATTSNSSSVADQGRKMKIAMVAPVNLE